MKNIHIIPTDKPSRLHTYKGVLNLAAGEFVAPTIVKNDLINQNIYITNDEEIKDCWVFNTHINRVYFLKGYYGVQPIIKKIILTTDTELMEDGIQSIDDEFLEWFVKNPSCKKVEIEYLVPKVDNPFQQGILNGLAKSSPNIVKKPHIIIPKEEPKQELNLNCLDCNDSLQDCTCIEDTINMTQETLTEAAENMWLDPMKNLTSKMSFIAGAKWQQERMYSEEDMKKAIRFGFDKGFCSNSSNKVKNNLPSEKEWFEQFKKK